MFPIIVLEDAAQECSRADFRLTPEIGAAIEEMRAELAGRCATWVFDQLRHAFQIDEPSGRWQNVNDER